jgi:putative membrane protein
MILWKNKILWHTFLNVYLKNKLYIMKTIKNVCILIASLATINFLNSCNNGNDSQENNDSKKEAEKHNDAKFEDKAANDAKFVADAADISLVEMHLGQLAENKATMEETKELGNMMSKDHKKVYDDLASLAAKKSISIPSAMTEAEQKDYNDLAQKTGTDFDKVYCDKMVQGHKDAIDKFEKESKNAGDADIQVWATNTLATLRGHLDHAMTCQERIKTMNNSASK